MLDRKFDNTMVLRQWVSHLVERYLFQCLWFHRPSFYSQPYEWIPLPPSARDGHRAFLSVSKLRLTASTGRGSIRK